MNPKDQIHYDIAEILEKIAHLNIKLAGAAKIHPVEIDLLRTYIGELEKLTDAMPIMPLSKPSFSIPVPQEEASTLPSFNTPEETGQSEERATYEPEPILVEEPVAKPESNHTIEEHAVIEEPDAAEAAEEIALPEEAVSANEIEEEEEQHSVTESDPIAWELNTTEVEDNAYAETAPVEPAATEEYSNEPFAHTFDEATLPDAPEVVEEPETVPKPTASEETETVALADETEEELPVDQEETDSSADINTPEVEEAPAPEPLPEIVNDEPKANNGPALPIVETPLSYEPPVTGPETKRSINDMFSREGKEDLGSRFQFQNRKNLREMIDLSERYVFTKELFGGDADYYDKAIRQLNQFETLAEAKAFMENELHNKYNWAGKEQVQKQFARIVERRYA